MLPAAGGDRFQLLGEMNGWYEIRLPDNRHGWVGKSLCEIAE